MKIHEFYRSSANITLNGSIVSLVPAIIIGIGNLYFFQSNQIMLLTIPFIVYSFISFQVYLYRMKQAIFINRNMSQSNSHSDSLFSAKHLVVVFMNQQESSVHLFFPDGNEAGIIKRHRQKGFQLFRKQRIYALYNKQYQAVGYYKIKKITPWIIEVYDKNKRYLGCLKKERITWLQEKKEMMDESGTSIGSVEGSGYFMDECVLNQSRQQVGRLRRGWMPVEWSGRFPEPNTPVLSLSDNLTEKEKLLRLSFLINEFFIER
ncbi:hypothetical protein [Neobacillus sp. DY30]|uniref:hypothetical protein n=1 Tax=Neobacillus sp. DY30 TaxID=3047871 RepID=UPI0024C02C6A|nr:hypothetical protein [Neobacillus sp. DY30]WHX98919.1 hypothetical protein QNH29_20265 [Neobacillus sp. DY30]